MLRSILLILSAFVLSACGGGGTSGVFNTSRVFSDGAGVGLFTLKNEQGYWIAPNIAQVTTDNLVFINDDNFPIVQVFSNGARLRQGAAVVEGVGINVYVIDDPAQKSKLVYYDAPGIATVLGGWGPTYTGAPSGNYSYNGTFAAGPRIFGRDPEVGLFNLDADFSSQSFTFSALSNTYSLSGSGFVNLGTGQLTSRVMNFSTGYTNRSASMDGLLHGPSAEGVSGVFHTNEANPAFAGGFAGTR